ncbi:GAF domain-containing protein [Arsukibacterium tuosuense]|uniref:GAF domain-containing protein n=1 Tax=Arsukibacterium tuosuense TaxID=1323745 RepID=A0A285ILT9_9GAMM|nr:GAF domain-containing protein [Arsukibacterium tuosuense]SNY48904.1 GAF domain-containing protein [Arsukibacterium tuosuense]
MTSQYSAELDQLHSAIYNPEISENEAREHLLRCCLDGLKIQQVGLWQYTDYDLLRCELLLDKDNGISKEALLIDRWSFPGYFAALDKKKVVRASDAQNDPATKDLSDLFLKPFNIKSLLDVPIYHGDKLSGIICCEQTAVIKRWTEEEVAFVEALADVYRSRFS